MLLRTLLRTATAPRAAIVLIPWIISYSGNLIKSITYGYWESVTAQSTLLLGFIAPACAACAAWESARIRQSGVLTGAPVRSPVAIAASALLPVVALGWFSVLLALAMVLPQALGFPGRPSAAIVGMEFFVVVAHAAIGYIVGSTLPKLLAIPSALIGSFLWMAYPAAIQVFEVRQLNGYNLAECCALDEVADPRSLLAPIAVAVGMIATSLVWVMARSVRGRTLAVVPLVSSIIAGVWVATPLGYQAGEERETAVLHCSTGEPRVCVWPEQQESAAEIRIWSSRAWQQLEIAGTRPAKEITALSASPRRYEVISLIALSAIPNDIPECATIGQWPGWDAQSPLAAWLILTAGADVDAVSGRFPESDVRIAQEVRKLPRAAQERWFKRNAATLSECESQPELDPSRFRASS